jgi:hypothetical protein
MYVVPMDKDNADCWTPFTCNLFEETVMVYTVGAGRAGERLIDPVTAGRSAAEANDMPTLRCSRLANCALEAAVTPLPTVTVHSFPTGRVAVFAVSVSVAVDVPDFVSAAVNAVEPHPLDVLRPPAVPILNVGRTRLMLSDLSNGALSLNV